MWFEIGWWNYINAWFSFSIVLCFCCCSVAKSYPVLCNPMDCSMPGFLVLHHLPESAQTHVLWVTDASNHLISCHSLLFLPSLFPSIKMFSSVSALHIRWPKYWSYVRHNSKLFNFLNHSRYYAHIISNLQMHKQGHRESHTVSLLSTKPRIQSQTVLFQKSCLLFK